MRKLFFRKENNLTTRCKIKSMNQTFSINCNGNWFFIIKRPMSCKKSFYYSSLFKKRSLIEKNLDNAFLKTLNLFFSSCFSKGPYTKTFTFSSIFLTIIAWTLSTCFFQKYCTICFTICYKIFFCVWIKNMHRTIVINQTFHDCRIFRINFFVIIYIIKSPINCIHIMLFPYFSLNMKCLKVLFHFFHFISIYYFLCCILFCLKPIIQHFIFLIPFH